MNKEIYAKIGYVLVWCVKYMFIPLGITVLARIIAEKLIPPQPERQRKKRSYKNRLK